MAKNEVEEIDEEYTLDRVPPNVGLSYVGIAAILFVWAVQPATLIGGGIIGANVPIIAAIIGILLGDLFLGIISIPIGYMGQRVRYATGMILRYIMGHVGSIVPSILEASVMLGWATFCWWIWSNAIGVLVANGILGLAPTDPAWGSIFNTWYVIGLILATVLATLAMYKGLQGFQWISYVGTPALLILMFYITYKVVANVGGWSALVAMPPPAAAAGGVAMGVTFAMVIAIGSWINGTTVMSDFTRMAKTKWGGLFGPFPALVIGESLVLILAAVSTAGYASVLGENAYNTLFVAMTLGRGVTIVTAVLFILMLFTTNPTTTYSSSLQWSNVFKTRYWIPFILMNIASAVLAAIIQFTVGAMAAMIFFLNTIATFLPALGGTMIAEYWIVRRGKFPDTPWECIRKFNIPAYIAWLIGTGVNWYSTANNIGAPGVNGFLAALVVYSILGIALRSYIPMTKDEAAKYGAEM
jgi:cytosine permease